VNARLAAGLVLLIGAAPASAQRVSAGVQLAGAEYAEQGASLRFAGAGGSGYLAFGWRRFGLSFAATHLAMQPSEASDVAEPFDITQTDIRFRVRATELVSVEAGFVHRDIQPLHAAQSMAATRLGAVLNFPLAVGSDVAVRASYLGGGKFSGGGSAPFGVEVGLGANYAPWSERVRITGDLEFQRLDRRITSGTELLQAPIQNSIARIGIQLAY